MSSNDLGQRTLTEAATPSEPSVSVSKRHLSDGKKEREKCATRAVLSPPHIFYPKKTVVLYVCWVYWKNQLESQFTSPLRLIAFLSFFFSIPIVLVHYSKSWWLSTLSRVLCYALVLCGVSRMIFFLPLVFKEPFYSHLSSHSCTSPGKRANEKKEGEVKRTQQQDFY